MTEKVCPPIVMMPVRELVVVLAVANQPTAPFPVTAPPELTESQTAELLADQLQLVLVLTSIVPLPPSAPMEAANGAMA
jgi:hypothetical protein